MAEEAVQEAFLQLIRGRTRGSLGAYLYGAVRNLIRAILRTRPEGPQRGACTMEVTKIVQEGIRCLSPYLTVFR